MEAVSVRRILFTIGLVFGVIGFGVVGNMYYEDKDFLQALWITIQTITTVGFGDDVPDTVPGKIFNIILIIGGAGTFAYGFGNIVGLIVEGHLLNVVGRKKMLKRLQEINDHIIICGAGRVGEQIIETLIKENVPFVAIDGDEHIVHTLVAKDLLAIHGDATLDDTLLSAGIERARGLISCLTGDAENVFVTLTAKGLNPGLHVVARAHRQDSEEKLKRAGADKVISPSVIGGRRMAISVIKPASVEFFDTLLHKNHIEIEIEELEVNVDSCLENQTLRQSKIRSLTGVNVLAIMRGDEVVSNPGPDEVMRANDLLIAIGTREQLAKLETICSREKGNS